MTSTEGTAGAARAPKCGCLPCGHPALESAPMLKLDVVLTSTRPGRACLPIGNWFDAFARRHGKFEVELVDLAAVNLPPLDEPRHPRLGQYEHAHTKAWSATVAAADAFVF